MERYATEREAKEYLAGKIVAQADRERAPLTEVERKMLYFTETGWTLPNILEVDAEFERDYDEDEYERKIGRLIRSIEEANEAKRGVEQLAWDEAVEKLSEGDHYLLILIDAASSAGNASHSRWSRLWLWLPDLDAPLPRKSGDRARLILVAFAVIIVFGMVEALLTRLFGPNWLHFGDPPPTWFG